MLACQKECSQKTLSVLQPSTKISVNLHSQYFSKDTCCTTVPPQISATLAVDPWTLGHPVVKGYCMKTTYVSSSFWFIKLFLASASLNRSLFCYGIHAPIVMPLPNDLSILGESFSVIYVDNAKDDRVEKQRLAFWWDLQAAER